MVPSSVSKSEVRRVLRGRVLGSLLAGASNAGAVDEVCAVHVQRDRDRVTGTTRADAARRRRALARFLIGPATNPSRDM